MSLPETPTLFLEFHGAPAAVDEEVATAREIVAEHAVASSRGGDAARGSAMWRARHQAYFAGMQLRPGAVAYTTDVCVPISALPELIALARNAHRAVAVPGPIVGHVGDGNFHSQLLVRGDDPRARARQGVRSAIVARAHELAAPARASTVSGSASARRCSQRWGGGMAAMRAISAHWTRWISSTRQGAARRTARGLTVARAPLDRRQRNVALLVAGCFFMENSTSRS